MQVIIPPEERERLVSLGSTGIMREIAEGKHCEPIAPYRDAVDALLASVKAHEEAAAIARAETREERMLSISERNVAISESALSAVRQQATWAKWAAVAAVIALIISSRDDLLKLFS